MSFYDAAKDALKLAQKADNIELVQKIMDIQSAALDMQNQLQTKNEEIFTLKEMIRTSENKKKYIYEEPHRWMIDPSKTDIKLCPTCLNRDGFESPLGNPGHAGHRYCGNCANSLS